MANFQIHKASSTVNWTGKKVLGLHTGSIAVNKGFIQTKENLLEGGEVEIDMTSIVITDIDDTKTRQEFLEHLQHDDFFSVDKFKTAKLVINHAIETALHEFEVKGDLTIKDITHPVQFQAKVEILSDYLYAMGEIIIDRTKYNIRYGSGKFISNLGDKLIYDDFVLQFKLVAQKAN
jgi:polyisoprenoid-binding protein YceI